MRPTSRLEGLDLARCLAFFGMVLVNFSIAMGADPDRDPGLLAAFEQGLQGRAAASFVVLAGLGLGLAAARNGAASTWDVTLRRAAFLMGLGLINALIFPPDILHYYAVYFLVGALALRLPEAWLWSGIALLPALAVILLLTFDYGAGWDWQTLDYVDFWSPQGFARNLVFNGFHPLVPWLSFFLFGLLVARWDLAAPQVQWRMAIAGILMLAIAGLAGAALETWLDGTALTLIATTQPMPPMPLFVLAGCGAALMLTGACLLLTTSSAGMRALLFPLIATGRQTLTLYIAHILIGMGTLEGLGLLGGQSYGAVAMAVTLFCVAAVIYATLWSHHFRRGPIEALMRRLAG